MTCQKSKLSPLAQAWVEARAFSNEGYTEKWHKLCQEHGHYVGDIGSIVQELKAAGCHGAAERLQRVVQYLTSIA
jgi:hypothetical protein